jgi:hypothetical protein
MNKIITLLVALIILNSFFSVIPFLMPRSSSSMILPYQLWFNVLIVFCGVLPSSVGNFDMFMK